jgi:MoxR-like ATPase
MPADITGTEILDLTAAGDRRFRFQHGPIFANLVLADEINRATPKTQSALLESMQENTVSVGEISHNLPQPFMVLATQNPIEMEGTYPLPEAQLDRFQMKLLVPCPDLEQLASILNCTTSTDIPSVEKILDPTRIKEMKLVVRKVPVASNVTNYIARLVAATHRDSPDAPELVRKYVQYGSSPRGGQGIMLSAKVAALRCGNPNVAFDDIAITAGAALRHRLILNFEGQADGISPDDIIAQILDEIPRD